MQEGFLAITHGIQGNEWELGADVPSITFIVYPNIVFRNVENAIKVAKDRVWVEYYYKYLGDLHQSVWPDISVLNSYYQFLLEPENEEEYLDPVDATIEDFESWLVDMGLDKYANTPSFWGTIEVEIENMCKKPAEPLLETIPVG